MAGYYNSVIKDYIICSCEKLNKLVYGKLNNNHLAGGWEMATKGTHVWKNGKLPRKRFEIGIYGASRFVFKFCQL